MLILQKPMGVFYKILHRFNVVLFEVLLKGNKNVKKGNSLEGRSFGYF